jgi:hypothetical protein
MTKYYQIRQLCIARTIKNVQDITCDELNIVYTKESDVLYNLKKVFSEESYFEDNGVEYDYDIKIPTIEELKECDNFFKCFNDDVLYVWVQVLNSVLLN